MEDRDPVREFLLHSVQLYPGIAEWFDDKVWPELRSGERLGMVLDYNEGLGGVLIAKRGLHAKICSLRIKESLRDEGWGKCLLSHAAEDLLRTGSRSAYVTVSEGAGGVPHRFFQRLGFALSKRLQSRYVQGVDELVYSWPGTEMRAFAEEMLSATTEHRDHLLEAAPVDVPTMVMSLKPRFSQLILHGRKTVEFRRRFSRKHIGSCVLFYVSKPAGAFEFTARIQDVVRERTEDLWSAFGNDGGIDKKTFDTYFDGREEGYALQLAEVRPLPQPLKLARALSACPELKPPQSFKRLRRGASFVSLWARAVDNQQGGRTDECRNPVS